MAHTLLTFVEENGGVAGYQTDLTVSTTEGDVSWLAYSDLQGAGMGYDVPHVVLRSDDGRSLFFTLRATPDGCGGFVGQFDSDLHWSFRPIFVLKVTIRLFALIW